MKYKTKRQQILERWYNKEIDELELHKLLKENEERLEKKRKLYVGEIITNVDDLMRCEFVYCFGNRPIHISFLTSMPFRLVITLLKGNRIRKSIRKDK